MDSSPGVDAIVLRASQIMEKAVMSLQQNTKKGKQDARDWYVHLIIRKNELSNNVVIADFSDLYLSN